jgi:hypothetical protein
VVSGEDVALISRISLLDKSAGHSSALRRNGYLRPAPHLERCFHVADAVAQTLEKRPGTAASASGEISERLAQKLNRARLPHLHQFRRFAKRLAAIAQPF